jgi:hypothetical protein
MNGSREGTVSDVAKIRESVVIPNPRILRVRDLLLAERGQEHRLQGRFFFRRPGLQPRHKASEANGL